MLNVATPAQALQLEPSTLDRMRAYVSTSFNYALSPLSAFADLLNKKGGYCLVVSSGYVDSVELDFPHYLCSKAAIEMLAVFAAKKYKKTKYLIVRPPKMLIGCWQHERDGSIGNRRKGLLEVIGNQRRPCANIFR